MNRWLSPRRLPSARSALVRPTLEQLEDRCLLAGYVQTNLVSDIPGLAKYTEPGFFNPWGIAINPYIGFLWTGDNGAGASTVYIGNGLPFPPGILVPGGAGSTKGTPTGVVFNPTTNFPITYNNKTAPSVFIFAGEDGTISAWNDQVKIFSAVLTVDHSAQGAVYKGLTLGSTSSGNFLYAANFSQGTVDTYDQNFQPVQTHGGFIDPRLPAGYAPFNLKFLGSNLLVVTYALQDASKHDEVDGPGLGMVDLFDTSGNFLSRIVSPGGPLNAPWGLAQAPANFGTFSSDFLIGNFGDGTIDAFNPKTGAFLGALQDPSGNTISINGLWGFVFGSGAGLAPKTTLYFAAGYNNEADGLFGSITASTTASVTLGVSSILIAETGRTDPATAVLATPPGPGTPTVAERSALHTAVVPPATVPTAGSSAAASPLAATLQRQAVDHVLADLGLGWDEGKLWD
jgi:uncharacterized protein (TIGR03118 family)